MVKGNKLSQYIEIYANGKSFFGRCYRPEVTDFIINSYRNGFGFILKNGNEKITIHSGEIINFFVNGFVIENPILHLNILDEFNVSNFSELKINTNDVIKSNDVISGHKVYASGREIIDNVQNWAKERGIDKPENATKQLNKLMEELGELSAANAKNNREKIIDSMGDMQVVMIILSMQLGIDYDGSLEDAYNVIKNRTGKTVNGVFVKSEDLS